MTWANALDFGDQTDELKEEFARQVLRFVGPEAPFKAANEMFPGEPGKGSFVAMTWPQDPWVKARVKELRETEGFSPYVPEKAEMTLKVLQIAESERVEPRDRIAAFRLAGDLLGYVEKPGANVNVSVTQQTVMLVKDHGTDDEWERQAARQQERLQIEARANS